MSGSTLWLSYAAVLALIFIGLSIRVVRNRNKKKVAFGDGGQAALQLAVRTHANFAEYVPLALLLLFGVETLNWPAWVVHTSGAALVVARLVHVLGLWNTQSLTSSRAAGAGLTWAVMAIDSILILIRSLGLA